MSYQQQDNWSTPSPGLSVGAIPLHHANASAPEGVDGDGEYGGRYSDDRTGGGYFPGAAVYGGYGGSSAGGRRGIFDYILSRRPLAYGIGCFLLLLLLTGGGGGERTPGPAAASATAAANAAAQTSTTTTTSSLASAPTPAPKITGGREVLRGITWLAYFPLSGAFFVLLVGRSLAVPTGTNYALKKGAHQPAFGEDSPEGPFWRDADFFARGGLKKLSPDTSGGDGTMLVATHCGGTCPLKGTSSPSPCGPTDFVETLLSFDERCRGTHYWSEKEGLAVRGEYDAKYVEKMVHLVRDPMANVVSLTRVGSHNEVGFREHCKKASKAAADDTSRFLPADVVAAMVGVPCPFEFFQYVQWHNLVLEEAKFRGIDRHVVYYEDFGSNQDELVDGLADFLDVAVVGRQKWDVPNFVRANMYENYYSDEERKAIWKLVETMALPKTMRLLGRYRS